MDTSRRRVRLSMWPERSLGRGSTAATAAAVLLVATRTAWARALETAVNKDAVAREWILVLDSDHPAHRAKAQESPATTAPTANATATRRTPIVAAWRHRRPSAVPLTRSASTIRPPVVGSVSSSFASVRNLARASVHALELTSRS